MNKNIPLNQVCKISFYAHSFAVRGPKVKITFGLATCFIQLVAVHGRLWLSLFSPTHEDAVLEVISSNRRLVSVKNV